MANTRKIETEPVNDAVADTWPQLKRKKWPLHLGPQPDAAAINVGVVSCGGRATLDALANAMRAREHGATNGEIRLLTTIAGAQPNEHRNQLASKLISGSVKLVSGEIKTPVKVFKGKGNETRGGQTVLRIALPAAVARKAEKAAEAGNAEAGKATSKRKAANKAAGKRKATEAQRKAAEAHLSKHMQPAKAAEAGNADSGNADSGNADSGNAEAGNAEAGK